MKGRVMPLVGIRWSVEAMLISACSPKVTSRPAVASSTNRLFSCSSRAKPRSTMKANKATSSRQSSRPNSSPATAKMKSEWASGSTALAGAAADEAAVHEGLERAVDLVVVAGGRIEEAVDALAHMGEHEIGAAQP